MLRPSIPTLALILLGLASIRPAAAQADEEITVYIARKVVTMDPLNPTATAVAVRGNQIVSVGSVESLEPWLSQHPHTIDRRLADKVILPGLIDPHLHPLLGALQFGTVWITPESWTLHDATIPAVRSPEEFRTRLEEEVAAAADDGDPIFIAWGWSEPEHGPIERPYLDQIAPDRPVMIWQRSVHEAVFNTAALEYMGLTEADVAGHSSTEVDWASGHFVEAGLFEVAVPRLAPHLLSPEFVDAGYARTVDYLTFNGVTTVGDLSTGQLDWDLELQALERNLVDPAVPFRTVLIPAAHALSLTKGGLDSSFGFVDSVMARADAPPQLVYGKRIKLFADGAMFSLLGQTYPPGYIDGHEGEWITPPDAFREQAEKYWKAGYRIHVHANGDLGIGFTVRTFEQLRKDHWRPENSLVLEHYGLPKDHTNRRVARLGATVSANPYYLHALGDVYANIGVGRDRAAKMVPVGRLVDLGVTVTLHSDFGMAPANPLFLAWTAITRKTASGDVYDPPRGLTRDEALKAVTIDAAYALGLDDEIGSIEAGKLADFSIFDEDPTTVPLDELGQMTAWGVMFEGELKQAVTND